MNKYDEKEQIFQTIIPLLYSSQLKSKYIDHLDNFNEMYVDYEKYLKCINDLYNIDIIEYFYTTRLSTITTKLYFSSEIIYEDEFNNKKNLIIGEIQYMRCKYIYCIIKKDNLFRINTLIPEYAIYMAKTLHHLLNKYLSIKEIKSIDSWFKARITGYTTDNLSNSYKVYDNFLDNYHVNFKLVQRLYNEYELKTIQYCKLNHQKYIESFDNILDQNNLYFPNKKYNINNRISPNYHIIINR